MSTDPRQLWGQVQDLLPADFGPVGSDAVAFIRKLLVQFPNSSSVKVLLADALLFADDPSGSFEGEAAKLLSEVVEEDPFCTSAYAALASLNSMQDRDEDAASNAWLAMQLTCNIETVVSAIEYRIDLEPVAIVSPETLSTAAELFERLVFRIRNIEKTLGVCIVDGTTLGNGQKVSATDRT